jgi:isoquinoline 1-oxidoreductase alpha subunit
MEVSVLELSVNGKAVSVNAVDDMPLLWVLRDEIGLKGTKFGCGIAQCGACTVHLDGKPVRSCVTPVGSVGKQRVTTVEALASTPQGKAVRAAWETLDVAQCGYCQAGQMMAAAGLLAENPRPSDADIDAAMQGNFCRCSTYPRIRAAIKTAAGIDSTDHRGA